MHVQFKILGAAVGTAALLAVAAPASANLLGNNGFESPAVPGGGPPEYFGAGDDWTAFGGGTFVVSSAVVTPNTGDQSFKTFGGASGAFQDFPAAPGQLWNGGAHLLNFSGDAMTGGKVGAVNIEWLDAGMNQISFISNGTFTAASPQDQWTLQTITGTAPAGTAFARLTVISGDFLGAGAGAVFYDDAFFELVPAPGAAGLLAFAGIAAARRRRN